MAVFHAVLERYVAVYSGPIGCDDNVPTAATLGIRVLVLPWYGTQHGRASLELILVKPCPDHMTIAPPTCVSVSVEVGWLCDVRLWGRKTPVPEHDDQDTDDDAGHSDADPEDDSQFLVLLGAWFGLWLWHVYVGDFHWVSRGAWTCICTRLQHDAIQSSL